MNSFQVCHAGKPLGVAVSQYQSAIRRELAALRVYLAARGTDTERGALLLYQAACDASLDAAVSDCLPEYEHRERTTVRAVPVPMSR